MLRRSKNEGGAGTDVLVVNDDADGCELVARIIEADGKVVARAHSHNDATQVLRQQPDLRAVIIDFTSGATASNLKLLDSIRHGDEANRETGVVVLAASATNRMFAFQSGADAFMVRPFHANELLAELGAVLGRSQEERARYRAQQLREAQSA